MGRKSPAVPDGKGDLIAVPAVHYRAVFADRVNAFCRDECRRPDAIAVELGASAVQGVTDWLRELRVDRGKGLPVMLGLMWRNRHLHPKHRETAIRLQREHGRPLHMIPKQVLQEYLNFSDSTLLCISPTDSIIEAIRCGLELNIPVHGVDLEEMAPYEPVQGIIEDPLAARKDMEGYVRRNMAPAAEGRDAYVDGRREEVMAARIKYLLKRHRRVLFTGGLGHWDRIQSLLEDPSSPTAGNLPESGAVKMARVLVKPSSAVGQMDIFPNAATHYEKRRRSAADGGPAPAGIDYVSILRGQLDTAYGKYLSETEETPEKRRQAGPLGLHAFEDFLVRICAVNHTAVPDAGLLCRAAGAMMPGRFRSVLENSLLTHEMTWATPENFPELPVLDSTPDCHDDNTAHDRGITPFFVANIHPNHFSSDPAANLVTLLPPFSHDSEMPHFLGREDDGGNAPWVWPPCEYIYYSTTLEAAEKYQAAQSRHETQVFEGSLQGGLDIRASLRSAVRGEDDLYVKQPPRSGEYVIAGGHAIEPSVFIFEDTPHTLKGRWSMGNAGDCLREYVSPEELDRFDHIAETTGSVFVSWVNVAMDVPIPVHQRDVIASAKRLSGIVLFGNPAANMKQSARWLKETGYSTCPVLPGFGVRHLFPYYRSRFGIDLESREIHQASALVMMAVPYARKRIMVVGPENFNIDARVQKEANARKVSIDYLPLTAFPDSHISKMRLQYFIKSGKGGITIPPKVERILGHKDAYLHMLPPAMQRQGR